MNSREVELELWGQAWRAAEHLVLRQVLDKVWQVVGEELKWAVRNELWEQLADE